MPSTESFLASPRWATLELVDPRNETDSNLQRCVEEAVGEFSVARHRSARLAWSFYLDSGAVQIANADTGKPMIQYCRLQW